MRLIDADTLWVQMKEYRDRRDEEANMIGDRTVCVTWYDAVVLIKNAPTVDTVPVIRCKECKYFTRDTIMGVTIPGTEYCIFTMNDRINGDDFCSRAERKEEW